MLGALGQQQGQYRVGRYLGVIPSDDLSHAPFFTYEEMGEKEKRYNHIVQNLITVEESVIIRTNYKYDWRNQARVVLQDGRQYMIVNMREYEEDVNPQAFGTMRTSADVLYYMELVGCDENAE